MRSHNVAGQVDKTDAEEYEVVDSLELEPAADLDAVDDSLDLESASDSEDDFEMVEGPQSPKPLVNLAETPKVDVVEVKTSSTDSLPISKPEKLVCLSELVVQPAKLQVVTPLAATELADKKPVSFQYSYTSTSSLNVYFVSMKPAHQEECMRSSLQDSKQNKKVKGHSSFVGMFAKRQKESAHTKLFSKLEMFEERRKPKI